jgi:CspA family cold shock protein
LDLYDSITMSSDTETHTERLTGKVKWFNNKAGYGFITIHNGEGQDSDIFVHFTAIRVVNSQYKYLVQGEYVEFDRVKSTTGPHEYKASDITGIKGGELMCETRNLSQQTSRAPRPRRDENPTTSNNGDEGYTSVKSKRTQKASAPRT